MDQVSYLDIWKAPLCVKAYWNRGVEWGGVRGMKINHFLFMYVSGKD